MNATTTPIGDSRLAARLSRELEGEVLFDPFSRGRYSTDASIYQIEPIGVVVPRHAQDIRTAMQIAVEEGIPLLPRGGGTSQCGQTVGEALVMDCSKHLHRLVDLDLENAVATVEPGLVLDDLNRRLKSHGLFYPVDVSTANRATLGGMAGNNSCGSRSLRYGNMVDNVRAIDGILPDGELVRFGPVPGNLDGIPPGRYRDLVQRLRSIAAGVSRELHSERWPRLQRRVGGYNLETVDPAGHNLAQLVVGSEGTLATFTQLELALSPIPRHKVLGVCHFPTFYSAMDNTRHLVALGPTAVELVDRTMIGLSREIPLFRDTVDRFVQGEPDALLLVEFAGEDLHEQRAKLKQLVELMGDLGFPGGVVEAEDPAFQSAIWEVRKAGLNIMMSMKGDGKPVSFIEDCAVGLEDLADYTQRLTQVFEKYGTSGTWYAHASVGCLHVRPILNLKDPADVKKMRDIAEAAFAMVREYKGSHSGEHGDGLVRSEFHELMFGAKITDAFRAVKYSFDPSGLMNPGKIVDPPKMDDRSLFRYKPGYTTKALDTAFDWSDWGGFAGAVEMCNNNGACRKSAGGVMCPSYRATRNERDLVRGRANTLRLALSGQLGPEALADPEIHKVMELCVGCKGCKRECPTGVDMAKMKTEVMYHYRQAHGLSLRDRLVAYLPRYAPWVSRVGALANLRDKIPGLPQLSEALLGLSAKRSLPPWHRDVFRGEGSAGEGSAGEVVLFADTFNTYFEPDNARAALKVLKAGGYQVTVVTPTDGRPLCCGRTFLAGGLLDQAKAEAQRTLDALLPYAQRGVPVVGLEPSCLFTLRDEFPALLPGESSRQLAEHALLFEEFLAREHRADKLKLPLRPRPGKALLHGHCHQKAFGAMGAVEQILRLVPELEVNVIDSSCCGMAGAFGYEAEHYEVSMAMGELSLLPAVRGADAETLIVADGTSCRHQIHDGTQRQALHVAQVLAATLD